MMQRHIGEVIGFLDGMRDEAVVCRYHRRAPVVCSRFGCRTASAMLAGWGMDSRIWGDTMVKHNERGLRTIAYDRRGHGRSTDRGTADYDGLAAERPPHWPTDPSIQRGHLMIGYVTLGVSNIERARRFYEALFATIGATPLMAVEENGFTLYGTTWDKSCVAITKPYDGGPAVPGNGNMVALDLDSREQVDAFHAKALELGGTCEGLPGVREPVETKFYGAYFRDPDGNKFCVVKFG